MIEKGLYMAVVGPAGIGKSTTFDALMSTYGDTVRVTPKVTTRPPREGETDTRAGMPVHEFSRLVGTGDIVMQHQPFGPEGHWYGYMAEDLRAGEGRLNLIEPNVEHQLPEFRRIFGGNALVVALTTRNRQYLEHNLNQRGTESPENIRKRLQAAESIIGMIDQRRSEGMIDAVVELDWDSRDLMVPLMMKIAGKQLSRFAFS
ncbi:MAG: Guanylate kinase [candidate division WS6 bacterium OLB20]|uniref:Guanylate kinase n=1 Tax=candidate division WS6 bacterium OLB20 TaxID=1617426 RepID=A0A136LZ34_9BACT|nr:MAG: Guanylate kinase [candidate division WS6 bacterium OLB20]